MSTQTAEIQAAAVQPEAAPAEVHLVVVSWQHADQAEPEESVWAYRNLEGAKAKHREIASLILDGLPEGTACSVRSYTVKVA